MKKIIDALLWVCVGANLAVIGTMQVMSGALSEGGLEPSQLALERSNFFNFQMAAFVTMIAIGGVDWLLTQRAKKQAANG